MSTSLIVISIVVLFLVILLVSAYMVYLQRQFLAVCREDKQLHTFVSTPAGLPEGTVRSMLTLVIVVFALYLLVISTFVTTPGIEFPEVLAALMTTVVGFYFGSRSASGGSDGARTQEIERLRQQKDEAVAEKDESTATALIKKVDKGIKLVKTVVDILPADVRQKYGGTLERLEHGADIAKTLFDRGDKSGAVAKAEELFTRFKQENPLRDLVTRSLSSFASVAGVSIPPVAIISAVVGISATLVGVAYAKWKARILRLPFSPAVIPLKLVDADTGFVLVAQSPVLKEAFAAQLTGHDRPFLESVAKDFLTQEAAVLWDTYRQHFASREAFIEGLDDFRRAAATLELRAEIDPMLLREVGGFDPLLSALDKIQQDDTARADLDLLVETTEGLRKAGEPVQSIFDKVRSEVEEGMKN
jgi:hypothetical protein